MNANNTIGVAAQTSGIDVTTGILLAFGVVIIGLLLSVLVFVVRSRRRWSSSPSMSEADRRIVEAEQRANEIIAAATEEARELRAAVEQERLKSMSADKAEVNKLIEAYSARLDRSMKDVAYGIEKEHIRATEHFVDGLQKIETRVSDSATQAEESMKTFAKQSGSLFDALGSEISNVEKGIQHLAVALEEAAANEANKNTDVVREEMRKVGEATARSVVDVAKGLDEVLRQNLEKEFAGISEQVEKYRKARLDLVDERILVLLEQTATIALNKELSLEQHADLVYQALEEAKEKGIFV